MYEDQPKIETKQLFPQLQRFHSSNNCLNIQKKNFMGLKICCPSKSTISILIVLGISGSQTSFMQVTSTEEAD
jgi:hypothetical protein